MPEIPIAAPRAASTEPPSLEAWREGVEKALQGRGFASLRSSTRDGIDIEPLYEPRTDTLPLYNRAGRPWRVVQIIDDPDPDRANEQIWQDLEGGATGLALRFDGAPSAGGFGIPPTVNALRAALERVDLGAVHLRTDPHGASPETVRWLTDFIAGSGLAPERADVSFGLDPISIAALSGRADPALEAASIAGFRELRESGYRGAFAELDTRLFHEAGASEAQELAAMLATVAWWLCVLDAADISAQAALPHFGASLAVDRNLLVSIAKLRAARLVWARLVELCGLPPSGLRIHAETSRRMLTRADPASNLLRNTIAAFAAGVGGADSVAVLPHTAALELPDRDARALARNIQHILIEEAHLHRIGDPAAGSGAIEALTDALAEQGWMAFVRIEQEGGIAESLRAGLFQGRIASARNALGNELKTAPLIGATAYHFATKDIPADPGVSIRAGVSGALVPISLETLAWDA